MDPDELAVFQLLSGGSDEFFVAAKFDWLRTFGAFLWYRFAPDQSIATVFRAFCLHLERCKIEVCDFRFNLLRLFAEPQLSASEVLVPESYGANPLNWRLAYMVQAALQHLPQRALHGSGLLRFVVPLASERSVALALARRLGEQLESAGLWFWAVFVLRDLPLLARDVLLRACPLADAQVTDVLVSVQVLLSHRVPLSRGSSLCCRWDCRI